MSVAMDKEVKNKKTADEPNEASAPSGDLPSLAEPTPEEITELKAQAAKAAENWDRLLRLTADFDNYKKRAARERQEAVSFANENLLAKLLPVMDAFDMALAATTSDSSAKSLQAGIVMVANQLKSALAEAGLEEINAAGKPFDPNLHEAVAQEETADAPEGEIIRQTRKGYKFRQRLLRPTGVIVAKKPAD
ncbi:MAG TPA: nucleotide exchange factor GrpE [Candidatus Cybelea sp.]|jgi:molecular chaperone GrpE|nr:nucleotide exchange factor GrpE [Candidatus Cybelea sp.]